VLPLNSANVSEGFAGTEQLDESAQQLVNMGRSDTNRPVSQGKIVILFGIEFRERAAINANAATVRSLASILETDF